MIMTTNVQKMIKEMYEKELKEIKILDGLMLDYDYTFYNRIKSQKIENIYQKVMSNIFQVAVILRTELCMNPLEYKELLDYEKEVINQEIEMIIENTVSEIIE